MISNPVFHAFFKMFPYEKVDIVNDPPPSHTLRGGGFVPLTRTQGIHMPAAPFDRGYVYAPD